MDMHDELKSLYIFFFHNWFTFLEFGCLNDLGPSSQAIFSQMWYVIELNFVLILFLIIRSQQIWRMLQQHNCYVCVMWKTL